MLFDEAYKEYLILGTRHLKKQSLETMQSKFNTHILPFFKGYDIYNLSKIDLLKWKNDIINNNYSNSFNNSLYVHFNSFLDFCVYYLNLDHNYLRDLGNFKKKQENKKYDFYTLKEFKRFIKGIDDIVYKEFFRFMFFTGCRPGEVFALRFSDIVGNYANISHNMTTKGGRELDSTKNLSSNRSIILSKSLIKSIYKLKKYYIKLYDCDVFDYYVFGGKKPLSPTSVNRFKNKACLKMNIRPITLHQFRHSHATLLLDSNIPITEISRRLGHSKVSTTLDIYVHSNSLQEKRVYNTLNLLSKTKF